MRPAEEVAAADHDRDLDGLRGLGDLPGEGADDVRVDAHLAAAEGLPGELEEDAAGGGLIGHGGVPVLAFRSPDPAPVQSTVTPGGGGGASRPLSPDMEKGARVACDPGSPWWC
jgi:hypothetical protein